MKSISEHIAAKQEGLFAGVGKTIGPRCERDELFDYFYDRLKEPWQKFTGHSLRKAFFATKIAHLKVHDLHYLKSICEDAERRGKPFSQVFWGSIKPR